MDNRNPGLKIEVNPASLDQKLVVANLLELYMHDFSDFIDLELQSDGRFGYAGLDSYWTDPGRHPFLVHVNEKPAGVALVAETGPDLNGGIAFDMAEFFIVRGFRRRAIGTYVARALFRRFPGAWRVRVMHVNERALLFWSEAIEGFAPEVVYSDWTDDSGRAWRRFSFDSRMGA